MSTEKQVDAYVRAYTQRPGQSRSEKRKGLDEPSSWSITFDCETTTDPAQALRFGFFQVRDDRTLKREGIFFDPDALTPDELSMLQNYAAQRGLDVCTVKDFRYKVLLRVGYETRAQIIGFNLPFDISRVATGWGEARGSLRGGFSFEISPSNDDPNIRVKHLSSTMALIDFAKPAGQDTPRGMRRRGLKVAPHRGYFYDVHTLGAALHSTNFTLGRLAAFLGTKSRKHEGVDYDGPLTETFLDYARADVQVTWECFEKLRDLYSSYGLSRPLHRIQSEASIGKASLLEMGIQPLLQCQPDFQRETFGPVIASYFGGRAEVRIRREIRQVVLTDFKSMYPTVNTLMGLWSFIIAHGYTSSDTTEASQAFLDAFTLDDLQNAATWLQLRTIVRLRPSGDILPLRTRYSEDRDNLTIGLNHVRSDIGLWYTLADVLASKILTGKVPKIDQAISLTPGPPQASLRPLNLLGRANYRVDPIASDGFKWLVDMRDLVRNTDKTASQAIKTIANSAAYGVSAEVNRDDAPKPEPLTIVGPDAHSRQTTSRAVEQPGQFFNPLLATLITGAARLMLAAAERVASDQGLDWVFCDTDSVAMAKPTQMNCEDFYSRAKRVVDWFIPLNPYKAPGSILKIEDINFGNASSEFEPLFAYAISAKRYSLFNLDSENRPVIRKFSAHGLGHLMEPYSEKDPAKGIPNPITDVRKLGGKRWQYDFWYHVLIAALAGTPNKVRRDYHPALSLPALSRYGATSPAILRWMRHFNVGKDYTAQAKPFGFLVAPIARGARLDQCGVIPDNQPSRGRPSKKRTPKPIAPFERDPSIAASRAFDRESGEPVELADLKAYAEALALYHVSSEDKFENAEPFDVGRTERRSLSIRSMRLIGKEANRVDETGAPDPVIPSCVEFIQPIVKASAPLAQTGRTQRERERDLNKA